MKRNQHFKKESILAAVSNLHAMIKREENDEVRAIYSAGNYVLSSQCKNFQVQITFGTPGMRIVKEIILINSGNKFKSFESSVIGKNFIDIASTVYQLKSKRIKYL